MWDKSIGTCWFGSYSFIDLMRSCRGFTYTIEFCVCEVFRPQTDRCVSANLIHR